MKETWRDKTRDCLCADLQRIGLDAHMAERGRAEEKLGLSGRGVGSLGIIDIGKSPICRVNVRFENTYYGYGGNTTYSADYGVPDPNVSKMEELKVDELKAESVRVKSVRVIGKVVGLRWYNRGCLEWMPSDMLRRFEQDTRLNLNLIRLKLDILIYSYPRYECWVRSIKNWQYNRPSADHWDCYTTVAHHLLKPITQE